MLCAGPVALAVSPIRQQLPMDANETRMIECGQPRATKMKMSALALPLSTVTTFLMQLTLSPAESPPEAARCCVALLQIALFLCRCRIQRLRNRVVQLLQQCI